LTRHKGSSKPPVPVILAFGFLLVVIAAWMIIPTLAVKKFGEPADTLRGFSRWNFSFQVLTGYEDLIQPAAATSTKRLFEISSGESISSIASRIEREGVIRDAGAFRAYLVYKGLDNQVKAGKYKISPSMTSLEIIDRIQSAYSETVPFYIYPGWRAEEIAAALPPSGIEVSGEEFLHIVRHPELLTGKTPYDDLPSLEGFLFPGQYEIKREIQPEELVLVFLERFDEKVTTETIEAIQNHGLSLYEGIILASIIQRETFMDDERPMMASVFYNRLAAGMRLETDPTVQYALGYSEKWGNWWKTPLKSGNLSVDSPFNTYLYSGLPPRPISNPDLPSILAVAYPEATDFYYFRARCDQSGYHDFSKTYEEHLSKSCDD